MSNGEGGIIGLQHGKQGGVVLKEREGKQIVSQYFRPHNPQTPRQMEVRGISTELSRYWRDELTQGLRKAWIQRAEPMPGIRGETLFIRQNFPLLDWGLDIQDTPPPMTMPPELTDFSDGGGTQNLTIQTEGLAPAIITAQTPFLDVEVAGGFTFAENILNTNFNAEIQTQAISQGATHQQSDFRHVIYIADPEKQVIPEISEIVALIPAGTTRNIVIRLTRINKYGHKSGQLIFDGIRSQPI